MVDKVFSNTLYLTRTDSHAVNVLNDIEANPGTTQADIQTRISLNATNTALCLDAWIKGEQVVERDDAGTAKYWTVGDWASAIRTVEGQIRTHLGTTDPDIFEDVATALSVTVAEVEGAVNLGEALGSMVRTEK